MLDKLLAPVSAMVDHLLGGPRTVVWMIGDGRSGSSWVADLIARTCNYRQLYEPFHPFKVRKFEGYALNHYQRPGSRNDDLESRLRDVFGGQVLNRRVNQDATRFHYGGLLVKDVFATLMAAWAIDTFPDVKPVLQVRNPFPVAVSKAKRNPWFWTSGPVELLGQPALVDDHLAPHADFLMALERRGDPWLNHVAVWTVLHYCFFRDVDARRMHIVNYRRIRHDPATEMRRLLAYVGEDFADPNVDSELLDRTARYSDPGSVQRIKSKQDPPWKGELSSEQIRRGTEVLDHFGLAGLFDGIEPSSCFEEVAASLWRGPERTPLKQPHLAI